MDPKLFLETGSGSKVKIQELSWLKMEPWKAVGAQKGGMKAQYGGFFRPVVADSHHHDEEQDPDPH
jgi:hypothetical protein